jgi:hypothetical protein
MKMHDLIILSGQIASLTLEVGDLHELGTRQRHTYRVGIVPHVAPPTCDWPEELSGHGVGADGGGPVYCIGSSDRIMGGGSSTLSEERNSAFILRA